MANLLWDTVISDRHTSITIQVCGASPATTTRSARQ
jgi:hypothetical protein